MKLGELKEGECAVIEYIKLCPTAATRVAAVGFVKGTALRCFRRSAGGCPAAFYILGSVFALRKRTCDCIEVRKIICDNK